MTNELKSIRVLNSITQNDMAKALNITSTGYRLKELGKNQFTLIELKRIKYFLKLTDQQLIDIFFK